ncbi:MAG: TIGR01777 family oxidoreductase [Methylococcales bacterium]
MTKILITGGTGFIGSALTKRLLAQNYEVTVLSRHPETVGKLGLDGVDILGSLSSLTPDDNFQIVINLAGAPIFDLRWTEARKQLIRESRVNLTEQLVACMATMTVKPELLISGSAIGYYGDQGDTIMTEKSEVKQDFSQQLCLDWEQAAKKAEQLGVRVCLIRTGLVLGDGGLLKRMLLPFQLGLGGRLGNGKQWMSWIHLQDWLSIAERMISDNSMSGAYNATAPNPVTNTEFTKVLAKTVNRPALFPLPAGLLTVLLGEMSSLVLGSQRVLPERLQTQGYRFQYTDLAAALVQIIKRS